MSKLLLKRAEALQERAVNVNAKARAAAKIFDAALLAVADVARKRQRFTSDAVYGLLERRGFTLNSTRTVYRALRSSQSMGFIGPTDDARASRRPDAKGPVIVWWSYLFQEAITDEQSKAATGEHTDH